MQVERDPHQSAPDFSNKTAFPPTQWTTWLSNLQDSTAYLALLHLFTYVPVYLFTDLFVCK